MKTSFLVSFVFLFCSFFAHGNETTKDSSNSSLEKVLSDALSEYYNGNLNTALDLADKAIDISVHLKEDSLIVKSLIYRANFLMETAKYTESISDLKQAYVRCEKLGDTISIATILGNIAVIFERMKEPEISLEYNLKALDIKKGLKDSAAIAASYTNIGNNYMDLGKYEKSLHFYNQAIEIDTTLNDKRSISADYNNFGILYSKLELFEKALFYYQKSYEIDHELNDVYGQAIGSNNIAQTYFDLLNLKNAERSSQISMSHSIESGSVEYVASNHKLLSNIYEQQGLDEKALKHQREYEKYAAQIRQDEEVEEIMEAHSSIQKTENKDYSRSFSKGDEPPANTESSLYNWVLAFGVTVIILALFSFYWLNRNT